MRIRLLLLSIIVLMSTILIHAQQPSAAATAFETASIRPSHETPGCGQNPVSGSSHYDVTCSSLWYLLQVAFVVDTTTQIEGNQHVLESNFDLHAVTPNNVPWTEESVRPMIQQLLVERFHLAYHYGSKTVSGYELKPAKGGSKLSPLPKATEHPVSTTPSLFVSSGQMMGWAVDANNIATLFTFATRHPVVNRTELTGLYTIKLRYAPLDNSASDLPSLFTVTKEQLGLELVPAKVQIKTVVVDHVDDAPTEN